LNLLHSKRVFGYLSKHLVCRVPLREKRVAFTFDDGPNPAVTPRLLELLARHRARATFFLIGRNVARYPELAADIAARGHEIGNHTMNHVLLPILPRAMMLREMEGASRAIHAATGRRPELFRPPMGWFSRSMLHTLAGSGYRGVLGDVYPQDVNRPGAPGSIVILHDGSILGPADRSQSVDALETILERLAGESFAFDTVSGLLEASAREAEAAASGDAAESDSEPAA
jgi:peptidoglycan/xylan/chitin deacetylase (PgdA/CDA1 family)